MQKKPAILYVEDESLSRKVMKLLLKGRLGLEDVTIFEDSSDFLQRAEAISPTPDVVLLDIHMQPHNGFEVLKMLRGSSQFRKTRVVALTASVMNEEVQQLQAAGFDGCLGKPINVDTFSDTLERILKGEDIWQIIS